MASPSRRSPPTPEVEAAWLSALREELHGKTYRPAPVRRRADSQSQWRAAQAGHPDGAKTGGADGGVSGADADLRGGLPSALLRLSARTQRPASGGGNPGGAAHGQDGSGRCRSGAVLRHDPASKADAVGGAAGERRDDPQAPQSVAACPDPRGRGGRWAQDEGQPLRHAARWRHLAFAGQPLPPSPG